MDIIELISSGGVAAIILAALGFVYKEIYKQPKLTYQILRPYVRGDERIVPIIFRNEGHANATNVRITITCSGPIQVISEEEIPENLETERPNQYTIIYKLDRLTHQIGIPVYITLSSLSDRPVNNVNITSDQGSGQEYKILVPLGLSDRIMLILGSFLLGIVAFILYIKLSYK